MNVKKYIVNNMSEALSQIKIELGPDAIILNTRNIKRKGIMGIFKPPMIEVIAAAEQVKKTRNIPVEIKGDSDYERELESKINSLNEKFEILLSKAQEAQSNTENTQTPEPVQTQEEEPVRKEERNANFSMEEVEFIDKLTESDVAQDIAYKVIEEAKEIKSKRENADLKDIVRHLLIQDTGVPAPVQLAKYRRKIVFLVGPTGVGKTTTIAKLAAIFTLSKQAKVCLVTCDTYRIAATDQLSTYAEILNIDIEIVRSPGEFSTVLARHEQEDLILVDTVGRSPSDPVKQEELMPLLEACDFYEVFLVMSASTSYKGIKHILSNYEFLKDYKLILTKTDETPYYGNLINIIKESKKRIGYITTGQNVPDDILELNEDNICNLVDKIIGKES